MRKIETFLFNHLACQDVGKKIQEERRKKKKILADSFQHFKSKLKSYLNIWL